MQDSAENFLENPVPSVPHSLMRSDLQQRNPKPNLRFLSRDPALTYAETPPRKLPSEGVLRLRAFKARFVTLIQIACPCKGVLPLETKRLDESSNVVLVPAVLLRSLFHRIRRLQPVGVPLYGASHNPRKDSRLNIGITGQVFLKAIVLPGALEMLREIDKVYPPPDAVIGAPYLQFVIPV